MRVQNVGSDLQSISCKGLYFTRKDLVLAGDAMEVALDGNIATSSKGIKYIKDTSIPKDIKERFSNNHILKRWARKFDTFVSFVQSKTLEGYSTIVSITNIKDGIEEISSHYVMGKSPYTQKSATEEMFEKLKKQRFTVI